MEPIRIVTNTIKSDGNSTTVSKCLEVIFQLEEDRENFMQSVTELGIGDDPQAQLYLLESMSFAGVKYDIQ